MKKVGILTLYFANNLGAILQAFSLQEVLKENGYDVEIIKLKEFENRYNNINAYYSERARKEFLNIAKEMYNLDSKYDVIVIGSDEVWNLNNDTFEHLEEYFGYNLNTDKIIAYAPCANGLKDEEFINYYNNEKSFEKFKYLSARDVDTRKLIKDISGLEVELVVDPTLLINSFDKYIKKPAIDLKDYIVLYGYDFSEEEKNKIIEFAKANNKKIFTLAYNMGWCETIHGDVFELLGYIKNADYMITNTFHGLLFSMILEKEFAVFTNDKSKILDVVKRYQIENRDAVNYDSLFDIFKNRVDYKTVNSIKLENRKKSLEYLMKAIEE